MREEKRGRRQAQLAAEGADPDVAMGMRRALPRPARRQRRALGEPRQLPRQPDEALVLLHPPHCGWDASDCPAGGAASVVHFPPVRITDILTDAEGIVTVWTPEERR